MVVAAALFAAGCFASGSSGSLSAHHDDPFLTCVRQVESGGNYQAVSPGGQYLGAYQFLQATWEGFGGGAFAPRADLASREQQIIVAERVRARQGWGAWPECSRKLGLR